MGGTSERYRPSYARKQPCISRGADGPFRWLSTWWASGHVDVPVRVVEAAMGWANGDAGGAMTEATSRTGEAGYGLVRLSEA
jgi:hypothetical protein